MNLNLRLISAAAIAVCSMASHAATAPNPNAVDTTKCAVKPATGAEAEALVANCAPVATLFIGGASTQKDNLLTVLKATLFDATALEPIEIVDEGSLTKASVKSFLGKTKAVTNGYPAGSLVLVTYNFNNGSAGGVSQLLAKTPALKDAADPLKGLPEANAVFVGPAKDVNTPGGTIKNLFCGTGVTGVATVSTTTKVGCKSNSMQTADMALSDVRAEELYATYPVAAVTAKNIPTLTQVPLFLQSFGVAVSQKLYLALQTKQGLTGCDAADKIDTAACQPSISRADYASLVSKGGKIKTLADLTGDATLTAPLILARRDDYSGTQAASNMFFVNGQCGGNYEQGGSDAKAAAASIDAAVLKVGGLMGGLAIRTDKDAEDVPATLDVQANATSTLVKNALSSADDYVIGVLGTGSGSAVTGTGTAKGRFVKIDGVTPNFASATATAPSSTATRAQIANGVYPFAYVMQGMYVTATIDKVATKKATVLAVLNGFKSSALTNLSGIAYLDSAASDQVAGQQSKYSRTYTDGKVNNCSPITKL